MGNTSTFMLWAAHCGGEPDREFLQSEYVCQFRQELQSGCCMALCCCWAVAKCNMDAFIRFINNDVGRAHVSGIQSMAIHCAGPAHNLGGSQYSGFVECVWEMFNIKPDGRRHCGLTLDSSAIANFCGAERCFTQIHFQSADRTKSHAVASCRMNRGIMFFDPNYGCCFFNRKGCFKSFLQTCFDLFYPDFAGGAWECFSGKIPGLHD